MVKPGDTAAEAAGLRWLAVAGGPPVPEVLGEDPLVTRLVPDGRPTRAAAEEFGRRLAVLHAAGADAFGSPPPGGPADALIGRAPMRNVPAPSWPEWYARDRVLPYVRTARDAGTLDRGGGRRVRAGGGTRRRSRRAARAPARRPVVGQRALGARRGVADRPRRARRPPRDRPGHARPLRLPAPGRRARRLRRGRPARRRLAGAGADAPAVPAARARGAVRPRLRRAGRGGRSRTCREAHGSVAATTDP